MVTKGKVSVFLNDKEQYTLVAGDVLNFNGRNFINAEVLDDAEIVVNLIKE